MRANDHLALVLIGRGNEHMTWRCSSPLLASVSPLLASASAHASASAASTRHVLRIRHAPAASSVSSLPLPALAAIVGADCLSMPLAGLLLSEGTISDLLDAGSTGKKPPPSALLAVEDALRASIESDHASLCDSANAWIEVDCTMATGAGGNICIEIKPKGAHLPVGRPLAQAVPGMCRFCLYRGLKDEKKRRKSPASSSDDSGGGAAAALADGGAASQGHSLCPLDLYSSDEARIRRACAALFRSPKNNLRVFDASTAALVFGGLAGDGPAQRQALRALTGGPDEATSSSTSMKGDGGVEGNALVLEEILACVVAAEQPLLNRVAAAQMHGRIGTERTMDLYNHAASAWVGGDEARLDEYIAAWQARDDQVEAHACLPCAENCMRTVESHTLDECVTTLAAWLLGLAASDVSLMIALVRTEDDHARDAAAACGRAVTVGSSSWRYKVTVVDAGAKPPSKIPEHLQLDREMVEYWRRHAGDDGAMAKQCDARRSEGAAALA